MQELIKKINLFNVSSCQTDWGQLEIENLRIKILNKSNFRMLAQ